MMAPGYLDDIRAIVKKGDYARSARSSKGAGTRNDTTAAALAALGDEECNVLLHDAVRPLVSQTIIAANVEALQTHEAVDTAIPSADTVIQVEPERGEIADVLPRHLLRRGQTPQSFRLSTIRAAYAKAAKDPNFTATDDCTVVLRYLPDVPIAVVAGHERNMKVTEPIDVYIADKLFQLTSADRPLALSDEEYRARLDGKTMVVFGGSYGIGGDIADLAPAHGATVKTFSRSSTGTHVEKRADIAEAAAQVLAETGRIDFVVNTAGVLVRGELAETSEETIYSSTEVNYLAPIFVAQEFFPHLREIGGLAAAVHLVVLHARPVRLFPVLLGQGGDGQPDPGAGRRVGRHWGAGELRQPGADGHADAHQGLRRGATRHAAVVGGGGPAVAGRVALRADRPHHRHPPRGGPGRAGQRLKAKINHS